MKNKYILFLLLILLLTVCFGCEVRKETIDYHKEGGDVNTQLVFYAGAGKEIIYEKLGPLEIAQLTLYVYDKETQTLVLPEEPQMVRVVVENSETKAKLETIKSSAEARLFAECLPDGRADRVRLKESYKISGKQVRYVKNKASLFVTIKSEDDLRPFLNNRPTTPRPNYNSGNSRNTSGSGSTDLNDGGLKRGR